MLLHTRLNVLLISQSQGNRYETRPFVRTMFTSQANVKALTGCVKKSGLFQRRLLETVEYLVMVKNNPIILRNIDKPRRLSCRASYQLLTTLGKLLIEIY